jgi:hypothetical protein
MNRIFKYTSIFFSWLAGFALVAHLIIPHDHHIADAFPEQDDNCNSKNNHSHNGIPVHCHAFNDLAAEKAGRIIIVDKHKNITSDYTCEEVTSITHFNEAITSTHTLSDPLFTCFFSESLHLRAPPAQA